ncbi:MAG: hypothetical protein DI539_26280 [Flavobacterium psychrophilum]|nr:MAG: hypothetical protein DI539_26280 [Flavobacterium psychrophilum]
MLIFVSCNKSYYKTKEKERKIDSVYNSYLVQMEYYLQHPNTDSTGRILHIRNFLNEATGIQSHGDRHYFLGRLGYTDSDIEKWRDWYKKNRNKRILIDKVDKKIISIVMLRLDSLTSTH